MYKAFEDYYKEESIKHLLLTEHEDVLISPPFATELCRDYSKIAVYDGKVSYIELELVPSTSKTNATARVNDSTWLIPYGIWDEFNTVVELKDRTPIYHGIDRLGKGQFYSVASNGTSACSFPLGYENTSFLIYIDQQGLHTIDFETDNKKCHMGVAYCNGKYWSMPRGDLENYNSLVSYDGTTIERFNIPVKSSVTRKFTDIITVGNTLYSLPFGETAGLTSVIEFDTTSNKMITHELDVPDFAKKYNAQVLIEDCIIGLPYGDEHQNDSNWGIIFNTVTKKNKKFDIGISHGGKYRYRSGIEFKGRAIFLPAGTVGCPIISVDLEGYSVYKFYENIMFGRPTIYKDKLFSIVYNLNSKVSSIVEIDEYLNFKEVATL
jgi:hypothetical protein